MTRAIRTISAFVVFGTVLALGPAPAGATLPGANGEIAYNTETGLRAMRPDGTGDHSLVRVSHATDSDPSYSADGLSIIYTDAHGSIVSRSLTTGDRTVILPGRHIPGGEVWSLSVSPDGGSVVFCTQPNDYHLYTVRVGDAAATSVPDTKGYCFPDWGVNGRIVASKGIFAGEGARFITTMRPDGTHRKTIATLPAAKQSWRSIYALVPCWAPDGSGVAFTAQWHRVQPDIWFVRSDGTGIRNLTRTKSRSESGPVFSPDGTEVAFFRATPNDEGDLWVMNSDGSNPTQLTDSPDVYEYPVAWQPTSS